MGGGSALAHHRGQTTSAGMAKRGEGRVAHVPSRTLHQVNVVTLHVKLFILLLALLWEHYFPTELEQCKSCILSGK